MYADGVLIVVTATQVLGYVSEAKKFGPPSARSEREEFNALVRDAEVAIAAGRKTTARGLLLEIARGDFSKPFAPGRRPDYFS